MADDVRFEEGHFTAPEQYCADDFEDDTPGDVNEVDSPIQRGGPKFKQGHFGTSTYNYGWDDFESDSAGSVHNLHNGGRSGDTLLKNGKFV